MGWRDGREGPEGLALPSARKLKSSCPTEEFVGGPERPHLYFLSPTCPSTETLSPTA